VGAAGQARRHDPAPKTWKKEQIGLKADIGFMGSANGGFTVSAGRPEVETNHEHARGARRAVRGQGMRSSLVNLVARFVSFG
jgi:hypothetical protein